MERIFVYGAGGQGKVVVDAMRNSRVRFGVKAVIDDDVRLHGGALLGHLIQGPEAIAEEIGIIAIGSNAARRRIAARYTGRLAVLVHQTAILADDVPVGEGSVLLAASVVNVGAKIGANVIINTAATIDHDCVIEDGVHIAPGCHLCGNVTVGEGAFLGVGTVVIPGVRIGRNAFIRAGQTITQSVADEELVNTSKLLRLP